MKYWNKLSTEQIKKRVFNALAENINYENQHILGVPASYLDTKIFNQDISFVQESPFISTLAQNPNHIGCHTLGNSESFFAGTQAIERELIDICAVDIMGGEAHAHDGYVASGGTEANIQAIWIYRNYFINEYAASLNEIAILCSSDTHYSMSKAANLLGVSIYKVPVYEHTRELSEEPIKKTITSAVKNGKKYFAVVCNMMTTMFGSVDDPDLFCTILEELGVTYLLHIDGAYGGFYYPFVDTQSALNFKNPKVSSITMDAHKMAQAPYGTGIFLIRKGMIHHVKNKDAKYVSGEDYTLIGSRSGANAVAVWMILHKTGPYEWEEKVYILQKRTAWFCEELELKEIQFYRHPHANIITIRAHHLPAYIAEKYNLVPDNHHDPAWYKIVLMEHVTVEKLKLLLAEV